MKKIKTNIYLIIRSFYEYITNKSLFSDILITFMIINETNKGKQMGSYLHIVLLTVEP